MGKKTMQNNYSNGSAIVVSDGWIAGWMDG